MKRHFLVDFGLEVKKWKKVRESPGSLTVEYQEKYL